MKQIDIYAEELFHLLKRCIPHYAGKICMPISGGIDSRVVAWLISQEQLISVAVCFDMPDRFKNNRASRYAQRIAGKLRVLKYIHVTIKGDDYKFKQSIEKLNRNIELRHYTVILPLSLETITGDQVNLKTVLFGQVKGILRNYFANVWPNLEAEVNSPGHWGSYTKWHNPIDNKELREFCLALPLKYRIHQRLFRYMINKYMPEMADIPQEGTHCKLSSPFWVLALYVRLIKKTLGRKL